jgi:hypothetical protein
VKPEKLSSDNRDREGGEYQVEVFGKMATVTDNIQVDRVTELNNPTHSSVNFIDVNNKTMSKVKMPGYDNPNALLNINRGPALFISEDTLYVGGKRHGDYFDNDYAWVPEQNNWTEGFRRANRGAVERAPNNPGGKVMLKPKKIGVQDLSDAGNYHMEYDSVNGVTRIYPLMSLHELIFLARMADPVAKAWLTDTVAVEFDAAGFSYQYPEIHGLGIPWLEYLESEGLGDGGMIKEVFRQPPEIYDAPRHVPKPIPKPIRIDRSKVANKNFGRGR